MKKRYWLWERNGVFYLDDSVTRQKEGLHTRDKREAERIRDARNEAVARPTLGIALAKPSNMLRRHLNILSLPYISWRGRRSD